MLLMKKLFVSLTSFSSIRFGIFLALLLVVSFSFAQQADITGKVISTDSVNNILSGAAVTIKGTSNGVLTDQEGVFTIENVSSNATLVVSMSGFVTQEISAGNVNVNNPII